MNVNELIKRMIEAVNDEPELGSFDVIVEEHNNSHNNFNIVEFIEG